MPQLVDSGREVGIFPVSTHQNRPIDGDIFMPWILWSTGQVFRAVSSETATLRAGEVEHPNDRSVV